MSALPFMKLDGILKVTISIGMVRRCDKLCLPSIVGRIAKTISNVQHNWMGIVRGRHNASRLAIAFEAIMSTQMEPCSLKQASCSCSRNQIAV